MKSKSTIVQVDANRDDLHIRDLSNGVSFTLRAKQQQLADLSSELEALLKQQIIDKQVTLTHLHLELQDYNNALYFIGRLREKQDRETLHYVRIRTQTNLDFSKQKTEQISSVVETWTQNLRYGQEQLIAAEKSSAEEHSKMLLLHQLLSDSREMYTSKLTARGKDVQALVDKSKEEKFMQLNSETKMGAKQRILAKLNERIEKRRLQLKDLADEKERCQ